jgi:hypothetical protein
MVEVGVAIGELFDKYTILQIKQAKGLEVDIELNVLKEKIDVLEFGRIVHSFVECLRTVNGLLWDIEDDKRQHEADQDFGDDFIELARLVYVLNDHRALLKRQINKYSNSEISEVKKHSNY